MNARHHVTNTHTCATVSVARGVCVCVGVCGKGWKGADGAPDPPVTVKRHRRSLKLSDNVLPSEGWSSASKCSQSSTTNQSGESWNIQKSGCVGAWFLAQLKYVNVQVCVDTGACVCGGGGPPGLWRCWADTPHSPMLSRVLRFHTSSKRSSDSPNQSAESDEVFVCSCSSTGWWGFCPRWVTASPSSLCSPAPSSCLSAGKRADVWETSQFGERVCLEQPQLLTLRV